MIDIITNVLNRIIAEFTAAKPPEAPVFPDITHTITAMHRPELVPVTLPSDALGIFFEAVGPELNAAGIDEAQVWIQDRQGKGAHDPAKLYGVILDLDFPVDDVVDFLQTTGTPLPHGYWRTLKGVKVLYIFDRELTPDEWHATARWLAEHLGKRTVVVWYDPASEFAPFIREIATSAVTEKGELPLLRLASQVDRDRARLAVFDGSFFKLRAAVEPFTGKNLPEPCLVYLPGVKKDELGSPLKELELAGMTYEPGLKTIAQKLFHRLDWSEPDIVGVMARPNLTYRDIAELVTRSGSSWPPSLLAVVFPDCKGTDQMLGRWITDESKDAEIESKGLLADLRTLFVTRFGYDLPADATVADARTRVLRYLLINEFRNDLQGAEPPASVAQVPSAANAEQRAYINRAVEHIRTEHPGDYEQFAIKVEKEFSLSTSGIDASRLGRIDTFPFEEQSLLGHCGELVARGEYAAAGAIVVERQTSFWLKRNPARLRQWEAVRRMSELGTEIDRVRLALDKVGGRAADWVAAYTAPDGWHRMDNQHRWLEAIVSGMDEDTEATKALALVEKRYEETIDRMALGFTEALSGSGWSVPGALAQTHVHADVVARASGRVAYFLVDALRYEMGQDLARNLGKAEDVTVRPAIAQLPTVTPVGMAALMPGASAGFDVVDAGGDVAGRVDGIVLPDSTARMKHFKTRVPGTVELTLDTLVTESVRTINKKVEGAPVVIVRSQEIDASGENQSSVLARRVIGEVVGQVAKGILRLARAGFCSFVVSADHGFLMSAEQVGTENQMAPPPGTPVKLHRRCWIGLNGQEPQGTKRVRAKELGYDSELEFVFPKGRAVFKSGGKLTYHHGGTSLQEMIVPVVTFRLPEPPQAGGAGGIELKNVPYRIDNRTFICGITTPAGQLDLLDATPRRVRPMLLSPTGIAGRVGMVTGGVFDPATGTVALEQGKSVDVVFLLTDDQCPSVRIAIADPDTDAVLRESGEIPVELSI